MKSKQVMLTAAPALLAALVLIVTPGCDGIKGVGPGAEPLRSPYGERRVWAVAPFRNESGSTHADGAVFADHLARQLEGASNIDVMPVNRVIAAMSALRIAELASPEDVAAVRRALNADAIIVGTISAYDPYDPPKLGVAVELYADPRRASYDAPLDIRQLQRAATGDDAALPDQPGPRGGATNVVSAFLDAADPAVRERMVRYATRRGPVVEANEDAARRYRISMDLYQEFAGYVVSWRLLHAESQRLARAHPQPDTR